MNASLVLADTTIQIGAGLVVAMAIMMVLCMGAMMFGMSRMGGGSMRRSSMPWNRFADRESPVETLERRFAAGEISVEEYRARRDALLKGTDVAAGNGQQAGREGVPSTSGGRK